VKAKKTIRHKSPLTRGIAKLQREVHGIERKMDALIKSADRLEQENREGCAVLLTALKENEALRQRITLLVVGAPETKPSADPNQAELWPELPNGEAVLDPDLGCNNR